MATNIPEYPKFKFVEFSDKDEFESYVKQYDAYSDFNFNSFYSWDSKNMHQISILNNNLIAAFSDYETGRPFYSVIGEHMIDETVAELLDFSIAQEVQPELKLVPEVTIKNLNIDKFQICEDENNYDYIYSLDELAELKGNRFKSKRGAVNKCRNEGVTMVDGNEIPNPIDTVQTLLKNWKVAKRIHGKLTDLEVEEIAIKRILENYSTQDLLHLTYAIKDGQVVGFSIDELLQNNYVLSHHCKTLSNIPGLSEYFNQHLAETFKNLGYKYWNWEQDLGASVLQIMKNSYRPAFKLKKFLIAKN